MTAAEWPMGRRLGFRPSRTQQQTMGYFPAGVCVDSAFRASKPPLFDIGGIV